MNTITKTVPKLSLLTEIGSIAATFETDAVTISTAGSYSKFNVSREVWRDIVGASAIYDGILTGHSVTCASESRGADLTAADFPIGSPVLGGGFSAGPHPTIPNATLITGGRSMEASGKDWKQGIAHCESFGDGWRAPTRFEAITLAKRLAPSITLAEAFKEGGAEAFAEEPYWTGEESQFNSDCACGQGFGRGDSGGCYRRRGLRVRPVRIVLI